VYICDIRVLAGHRVRTRHTVCRAVIASDRDIPMAGGELDLLMQSFYDNTFCGLLLVDLSFGYL
jgi:hypothetical protein